MKKSAAHAIVNVSFISYKDVHRKFFYLLSIITTFAKCYLPHKKELPIIAVIKIITIIKP